VKGKTRRRALLLSPLLLSLLLARPLAAQSDSVPHSVRLPDGVVEFEARPDGRVAIGAVETVRMAVAAGSFAPLALLTWLDELEALAAAQAGSAGGAGRAVADTIPLQSADGTLLVLASRARSASDEPGLMLTFARTAAAPGARPSPPLRLFVPIAAAADSASSPLVRLRAAATAAATRARALAPPPGLAGAAAGRGGTPDARAKRPPTADRVFVLLTVGVAGAIAGARVDGATLGCETYQCWHPGIEGLAVGGAIGYALGATLTRNRDLCGARRAFILGAAGATLGAVPGLVVATGNRPRAGLPLILLGQAAGAVAAARWCG